MDSKKIIISSLLSSLLLVLSGCGSSSDKNTGIDTSSESSKSSSTSYMKTTDADITSNSVNAKSTAKNDNNGIAIESGKSSSKASVTLSITKPKNETFPPKAPQNLHSISNDTNSITIAWSDISDNEDVYDIYVNGRWVKAVPANTTTTTINNLNAGTSYSIRVTAKNRVDSVDSNLLQIKTNSKPQVVLNGDEEITLVLGDSYKELGATASDDEDGDLTIRRYGSVNTNKTGTYKIRYYAKDSKDAYGKASRVVKVITADELNIKANIPYDANLELGNEEGILYYVDPRPEEHGHNRALKVDYLNWSFEELKVTGINPHSLDRAGDSDKFYVRTQNSHSFDVINFKTKEVKRVDLGDLKPRAIGATNLKYNLQLLSGKNKQVLAVIDTTTDKVLKVLGDPAPSSTGTGHSLWFDEDHFGLIDRVKPQIVIYKVEDKGGVLDFVETDRVVLPTSIHAIEKIDHPKTREDLVTFYANGEGDIAKGGSKVPYIMEMKFDPIKGKLSITRSIDLTESTAVVHGRPPLTHHTGVSLDGKYLIAPVFDGNVYIIDRETMTVAKVIKANLGAAHVTFSKSFNYAIITNHWSNELTVIDLSTLTVKKRIIISTTQQFHEEEPHLLQPHFSYLSKDGRYFYTFATQDGDFLEIDLETFEITRKLHTGGAPEQAHS